MIRIKMLRSNTRHPDKRRRHQGRASCVVAGRRFEAQRSAPIYKITTLLWLHGHGGADFEVWDDLSPFGKPGGLAMRGRVQNWARLVKGKPVFNRDAPPEVDFSSHDRRLVAQAAGRVAESTETDSARPENVHTAPSRTSDGPEAPPRARWGLYARFHRSHPGGGVSRIPRLGQGAFVGSSSPSAIWAAAIAER